MKQRECRRRGDRSPRHEGLSKSQQRIGCAFRNCLGKKLEVKACHCSKETHHSVRDHGRECKCNTRNRRVSLLDAERENGQYCGQQDEDSISVTLSTVSCGSDDSSYFNASENKERCEYSIITPSRDILRESDDGYSSDQAVCDNTKRSGALIKQRCKHKQPLDHARQEASKIVDRLLQEQTIALEAWDEVASEYHRRIEPFTSMFIPRLLDHKCLSLKDEHLYLSGKSVLDVASGTGAGALYAISRGASSVMATDFSENMLQVLQSRIQDHPSLAIETQVANGLCLPLRWEKKYDIVFSNFGCIYFPKVKLGLLEMIRCAKPGGKVCLSAWGSKEETCAFSVFPAAMKRCGLDRKWFAAQTASRKNMLASSGIIPSTNNRLTGSKQRYSGIGLTPNYICPTPRISSSQFSLFSMMIEAGLTDIQVIPVTNDLQLDGAKNYWKRFVLASPNLKRFVEHCLSVDEVRRLRHTVSEILEEKMEESSYNPQEGGVVLKASAYIAIGTKAMV